MVRSWVTSGSDPPGKQRNINPIKCKADYEVSCIDAQSEAVFMLILNWPDRHSVALDCTLCLCFRTDRYTFITMHVRDWMYLQNQSAYICQLMDKYMQTYNRSGV